MNRAFLVILFLLLAIPTGYGQVSPAVAPPQGNSADAPDPAAAKQLVETLKDSDARAKLIRQLDLLAKAQAAEAPAQPDPLGSRILKFFADRAVLAGEEFASLGRALGGLPAAERWITQQVSDPNIRNHWLELAGSLAAVVGAGALVWVASHYAFLRPRRLIERHATGSHLSRIAMAMLRLLLWFVPIVLSGAVGFFLLSLFQLPAVVGIAAVTMLNAGLLVLVIVAFARFVFSPGVPGLRLWAVDEENASYLFRWLSRIGAVASLGWFSISAAQILGLPPSAAEAALKLLGLVVLVGLIILIFRKRADVSRYIRGPAQPVPLRRGWSGLWSLRARLADSWHIISVILLVAVFVIWSLELKDGFEYVARGIVMTIIILGVARLTDKVAEHFAARTRTLSDDLRARYPRLQERVDRYAPAVHGLITLIVWGVAILGILDAWSLDLFGWFDTPAGRVTVGRAASITIVVVGAIVLWEFVAAIIERYLVGVVRDGSPVERSQRVRTLLPLLRNAFLVFLIVVVVLTILSEIGLNIAPLLAGAGVVGLAIGFGAQSLVKDIITGIFILFENTIAVGDVVDVGAGHSGLVEAFSIRTIRLRDNAGSVHTVPFSNVTSVVNMTREFSFYVFNVKMDYSLDSDRIVAVLKSLGEELQADQDCGPLILGPIEVFGIDSFASDAVVIQGRIKTRPIRQWGVGREFNRRLKKRFEAEKIPMSFPTSIALTGNAAPTFELGRMPDAQPSDGSSNRSKVSESGASITAAATA